MPYSLTKVKANAYADDTSLIHSDEKLDDVIEVINSELENLKEQLHDNKLSLNIEKTISIIVGLHKKYVNK